MKATLSKEQLADDTARLKAYIEANNGTVYTILRHVSKSGMYREISIVIPVQNEKRLWFIHPSYAAASLLGWSYSEKHGHSAVAVHGCGMDMGFHLVEALSWKLYGTGGKIKQEWI